MTAVLFSAVPDPMGGTSDSKRLIATINTFPSIQKLVLFITDAISEHSSKSIEKIASAHPNLRIQQQVIEPAKLDYEAIYRELYTYVAEYEFRPYATYQADNLPYAVSMQTGDYRIRSALIALAHCGHLPAMLIAQEATTGRIISFNALQLQNKAHEDFLVSQYANCLNLLEGVLDNKKFTQLKKRIAQIATYSEYPILLTGPTGSGKTKIARLIHQIRSEAVHPQSNKNFVHLNCSTLNNSVAKGELVGYKKGAFTGALRDHTGHLERADGGTLFLDEIGDLPLEVQAELLLTLDGGTFQRLGEEKPRTSNFLLICATWKNLQEEISKGNFRQDLYERISIIPIEMPTLIEQRESIPDLIRQELDNINNSSRRKIRFEPKAMDTFVDFAISENSLWPGNFRELFGLLKRITVFANADGLVLIDTVLSEINAQKAKWMKQTTNAHLSTGEEASNLTKLQNSFPTAYSTWSEEQKNLALFFLKKIPSAKSKADFARKFLLTPGEKHANHTAKVDSSLNSLGIGYDELKAAVHN